MLAKSKLSSIEVLINKALIDSNTSHDELALIYNLLKIFIIWRQISKIPMKIKKFKLYIKQCYLIVWNVEKIQKVKIMKL